MAVIARLVQVAKIGAREAEPIWRMRCMLGLDDRTIEAVRAESLRVNGFRPGRGV